MKKRNVFFYFVFLLAVTTVFPQDFSKLRLVLETYQNNNESYVDCLIDYGFSKDQIKSWRFTTQQLKMYFSVLLPEIEKGDKVFSTNIGSLKAINDVTKELSNSEYEKLMSFISDVEIVAGEMRDERLAVIDKKLVENTNGLKIYGYNLTYDGNGNTGGTVPIDETLYRSGTLIQLKDGKTMSRDGYKFMGWSFDKDATSWLSSAKINISHDTTVYAVWAEDNPQKIKAQEPAQVTKKTAPQSVGYTVYIGKSGTKYHTANCRTLQNGGSAIDVNTAKNRGYSACKICNP